MTNVVPIKGDPPKPEPDEAVVELLEDMLKKAKAGQLKCIAYTYYEENDDVMRGCVGYCPIGLVLVGSLAALQQQMVENINAN